MHNALRAAIRAWEPIHYPALPGRTNHIRAGILVPLLLEGEPRIVLTLRPESIRHGGEVSFPGGRMEAGDADLCATALREANEEIGVSRVEVFGPLSSMPVYTSEHRLEPWVAAVEGPLVPNPAEVARIVHVAIPEALSRSHIDAIPWEHEGETRLSPVFVTGDLAVFGATAHTLLEFLEAVAPVFGVKVPGLKPGRFAWKDMVEHRAMAPQKVPALSK